MSIVKTRNRVLVGEGAECTRRRTKSGSVYVLLGISKLLDPLGV